MASQIEPNFVVSLGGVLDVVRDARAASKALVQARTVRWLSQRGEVVASGRITPTQPEHIHLDVVHATPGGHEFVVSGNNFVTPL
jgi:hypothetical protein